MTGQAKIVKGAIDFYSRLRRSAAYEMKGLMRMIRVLTVQSEPSIRFQDTEYFCERSGFVFHPMKNAIQINNIEGCVGKLRQILRSTDTRLEISRRLRLSDFDPQRQWVYADNSP